MLSLFFYMHHYGFEMCLFLGMKFTLTCTYETLLPSSQVISFLMPYGSFLLCTIGLLFKVSHSIFQSLLLSISQPKRLKVELCFPCIVIVARNEPWIEEPAEKGCAKPFCNLDLQMTMALFFSGSQSILVWTLIIPDSVSIVIRIVPTFRRVRSQVFVFSHFKLHIKMYHVFSPRVVVLFL